MARESANALRTVTFAIAATLVVAASATIARGASEHRQLDRSFAENGRLTIPSARTKSVYGLTCETDRRNSLYMLVSEETRDGRLIASLAKSNRHGKIDRRFGRRGFVKRLPTAAPDQLNVDTQRRVILIEDRESRNGKSVRVLVSRLRANGETDTGFGRRGMADLGRYSIKRGVETIVLDSGRIARVVHGAQSSDQDEVTLFNNAGKADSGFGENGTLRFDGDVLDVSEMQDGRIAISEQIARNPADKNSPFVFRIMMLSQNGAMDSAWANAGAFDAGDLQEVAYRAYHPGGEENLVRAHGVTPVPTTGGGLLVAATFSVDTDADPEYFGWSFRLTKGGLLSRRYGRSGIGSLGNLTGDNEGDYSSEAYLLNPLANGRILIEDQHASDEDLFESSQTLLADGRKYRYGPGIAEFRKTEASSSVATADGKRIYLCGVDRAWRAWALKTSR